MKKILVLVSVLLIMGKAYSLQGLDLRGAQMELAKRDFWTYCQLDSHDFYQDDRTHLIELCNVLQALYESRIIKSNPQSDWQIVPALPEGREYHVCKKLMINIPPRHGKSRTLVLFTSWVLGKNVEERVITCSYTDTEAQDFSRYCRDKISEEPNPVRPSDIIYSDIFPNTKIKYGDKSYKKWALENQFFNYKGSGIGGAVTGKGGSLLIIDDPVKDAETAYNDEALDKIWKWYTGTFLQRKEEGAMEIICHTRWAKKDVCGRLLDSEDAQEWYIFEREAYNEQSGMLCNKLLSYKSYTDKKKLMDKAIFEANYHQKPLDIKGRLYKSLKTYREMPRDENGNVCFERIISYTDTADEGNDYLCSIVAGEYQGEAFLLDVLYTKDGMEVTEPATAELFVKSKVSFAKIESNNGGRGFARNVRDIIWQKYHTKKVVIEWFHQTQNKKSRILTSSNYIMQHVYFPWNWSERWPEFFRDINGWQKEGVNRHDDAPDALTGLAEMVDGEKFEFDIIGPEGKVEDVEQLSVLSDLEEMFYQEQFQL